MLNIFLCDLYFIMSKLTLQVRNDTHTTSMKLSKFQDPLTPVHLRPKFFHPLDPGRPILNEPSYSSNDNQSIKRKRDPRTICHTSKSTLMIFGHDAKRLEVQNTRYPSSTTSDKISFFPKPPPNPPKWTIIRHVQRQTLLIKSFNRQNTILWRCSYGSMTTK